MLSPVITSYTTFLSGVILLVSSTIPGRPDVVHLLETWLPEWCVGFGHMLAAISGCMLLFVSYGLSQRQKQAFYYAATFMTAGIVCVLLKGLAWHTALAVLVMLLPLLCAHHRFYRKSWILGERIAGHWVLAGIAVILFNFGLGWAIYHWKISGISMPANAGPVLWANMILVALLTLLVLVRWVRRRRLEASGAVHPDAEDAVDALDTGDAPDSMTHSR